MGKKEINTKGYKVVLEDTDEIKINQNFLLNSIEAYALLQDRSLKVVFFNYDDDGSEAGVTFFFRKEKGSY